MTEDGNIFQIKALDERGELLLDKRKTISPFNSVKTLKHANLPAHCDDCVYRSIDSGGNGKCPKYEAGAVCAIRKDFIKFINALDTRNPEDLKSMLDVIAKMSFEDLLMALYQSKMDGNIPDRGTTTQINNLLNVVKVINELNNKIVVTEKRMFNEKGDLDSVFRMLKGNLVKQ